jgi:hypothetical protein
MAPGRLKNTSQKMGLTSSNNIRLLNIGISTRNIGRLVSENDENMTVNRVSLQNKAVPFNQSTEFGLFLVERVKNCEDEV